MLGPGSAAGGLGVFLKLAALVLEAEQAGVVALRLARLGEGLRGIR
jgi:hypothetical protein